MVDKENNKSKENTEETTLDLDKIQKSSKDLDKKQKNNPDKEKINELTRLLQITQAEFENYKKRVERDKQTFCELSNKAFIEKILPVIDNFELALKNVKDNSDFVKGMELIYSQLLTLLEKEGVKPINAVGEMFDPYLHEALMQEESDKKVNTVLEEFQKGYFLKDKVLRHTKVKVAKPRSDK